jgi:hypothetical protein
MNIGIYQTVNAHAPAIHWWLAQDPRFGPQLYKGLDPKPKKMSIGIIVDELRNDIDVQTIDAELYECHQETMREMENKKESLENGILKIDCTTEYFNFNNKFEYPVWSNYFGCTDDPKFAPKCDKLIFAQSTIEESAMFYITQYAFKQMDQFQLEAHCEIWWKDHMLMSGDNIGKWKEIWYRDYHNQCIEDLNNGKLQYMWQLNFAHWDLHDQLLSDDNPAFKLDYSFHRLFKEKHDPGDIESQNRSLSNIQKNNIDHLVVDVKWFNNTDVILDYLGISNSTELDNAAQVYSERYKQVVEAYDILYNKYYK